MVTDFLALTNDIIQAIIVIFGTAVVLYNLPYVRENRVSRTYSLLLGAVVVVFLTELLVSRVKLPLSAENWLTFEWLGITFVPAIQFHFSDALLVTTGSRSRRRRIIEFVCYIVSLIFFLLVISTDLIVDTVVETPNAFHLRASSGFYIFAVYFWTVSVTSIYNVLRAYQRSITRTIRRRIGTILLVIMAAPLSVFPYLALSQTSLERIPAWAWLLLIIGNLTVGLMFSQLTSNIVYLGSVNSNRVVRVKLLKFMARVPMTASIVLLVYVLTVRTGSFLGLDVTTGAAAATVGTVMLVEWAIHAYKRQIERVMAFNNEPDVRRIQELSERLITRQDMSQFLSSLLAAGCEALRAPVAFVASINGDAVEMEALVSSADPPPLAQLPDPALFVERESDDLMRWENYWIRPLYTRNDSVLVGILGIAINEDAPYRDVEEIIVERIAQQAISALEDQLLQQSVFAAVEGLLPALTALQKLRGQATFSGAVLLEDTDYTAHSNTTSPILESPRYTTMVKDALDHLWGGPKLTESPLLDLEIVQDEAEDYDGNVVQGLKEILKKAIERQRPEGEQSLTRTEWLLYNILDLRFVKGNKVREVTPRLVMSDSDFYRKQRVAIENVARAIAEMEEERLISAD
jgi:hypothetical protein